MGLKRLFPGYVYHLIPGIHLSLVVGVTLIGKTFLTLQRKVRNNHISCAKTIHEFFTNSRICASIREFVVLFVDGLTA